MSAHTSTHALILEATNPVGEPDYYDFNGDILADRQGWVAEELVRRANAGDDEAKAHLARERREDIHAAFLQRIALGDGRKHAVADIAVGWNVPQEYVRRVLRARDILV